ncbi:M14 family zinc carboxypeptidase [Neolewinella lacunae]|uniref:Zinc carboxypeptidase n=1 Tax=Neolewinella lacunae TaxID=1517758 RepID=A0A923PMI7_9BACT|nr:M14 family zinc carboxypeptidase [Neolewinella lacunae]MBC6993933.1 zinc carboxypeptidase [Neolewinella lacunae]MDN3634986.1 M14 family zinc carboxypeptidase [Neolewinella lacunae]
MRAYPIFALLLFLCTCVSAPLPGQTSNSEAPRPLTYYLPALDYNPAITTPEEFLGWQIGDWHLSHDLQLAYMRLLASQSDRIVLEEIGRTYEDRPLVNLIFTSPANHAKLGELREKHLGWNDRNSAVKANMIDEIPAILYQGFSIHGNEASGGNAAPLVAYYLAAAPASAVGKLLDNNIVLFDPCYNPDGFNRFASWANVHKNKNLTADGADREYSEAFPGGRTNHYWFDLNRDWLPVQHPESRARIAQFHKWKPNVLTDHHEMGKDATFFFMPGEPTRVHPLTPKINQELTYKIGQYHAAALDEIGSLYYSGEGYDDFYYGKGSTYPDINGCVGILFEQASSRGHLQETENGLLSFAFTIRNQVATALSTHAAFADLRNNLLTYQREFHLAQNVTSNGYLVDADGDAGRTREFIQMLQRHQVDIRQDGPGRNAPRYFVPETPFTKAIFDPITTFEDSLFYDVSTFVMPHAYNLPYERVTTGAPRNGKWQHIPNVSIQSVPTSAPADYAYLLSWDDYYAAKALYQLLAAGVNVKVSSRPFRAADGQSFSRGTIMVPVANNQTMDPAELHRLINEVEGNTHLAFTPVSTGTVAEGLMLGSRDAYQPLRQPKIALLIDGGVSSYDAGETWHLLDQRFGIPITKLPLSRVGRTDLSRYNTIIMVDGSYNDLGAAGTEALKRWLGPGNVLITQKRASSWAAANGLANVRTRVAPDPDRNDNTRRAYASAEKDSGGKVLGGAIFQAQGDLTHPLLFGMRRPEIPVFKRSTLLFEPSSNAYASPLMYREKALLSGYSPRGFEQQLSNTAAVVVSGIGGGRTISFADNPNFRGHWYGTNRVFLNAIFFGATVDGSTTE